MLFFLFVYNCDRISVRKNFCLGGIKKWKNSVKNLIQFIDHSPSCFHVIENAKKQFLEHGFIQLEEKEHWNLEEGKSYFVERNGSSMIAFHLPKKDFQGFHIVASHSDSPTYRIKEQPEMSVEKHYTKLNIERYGGMIPEHG